uniref:NADH-ubiquinone oxidoreductase chain 6 n=1 Tax=Palaemon sinensis TaxID=349473 RepID=A0A7U1BG23_9EUCA|nr:NADH dehydrogenase subunit 6 [Palaemon sinensis]
MYLLLFFSLNMISVALCFTQMAHPMAMGLTLIAQTTLICVTSGLLSGLSWFSYILFLIFLGATLVLFIYVASLASNEIFKINMTLSLLLITPLLTIPLMLLSETLFLPIKNTMEASFFSWAPEFISTQLKLSNMYNPVSANLTAFLVLYLFLTLIVVVKLSSSFYGPLRTS